MNKDTKRFLIIVLVIIALIGGIKIFDSVKLTVAENMAVSYLCKKYDAEKSDFKLLDSRNSGIYFSDSSLPTPDIKWKKFAFEFEYNGRNFFVNRIDGKFYDDYQLEDLEVWCTEWLKENVDDRIVGIVLKPEHIINFADNTGADNYFIFSSDNAKYFVENSISKNSKHVFYFSIDEKADYKTYDLISKEIAIKISNEIKLTNDPVCKLLETYIEVSKVKYDNDLWTTYIWSH